MWTWDATTAVGVGKEGKERMGNIAIEIRIEATTVIIAEVIVIKIVVVLAVI